MWTTLWTNLRGCDKKGHFATDPVVPFVRGDVEEDHPCQGVAGSLVEHSDRSRFDLLGDTRRAVAALGCRELWLRICITTHQLAWLASLSLCAASWRGHGVFAGSAASCVCCVLRALTELWPSGFLMGVSIGPVGVPALSYCLASSDAEKEDMALVLTVTLVCAAHHLRGICSWIPQGTCASKLCLGLRLLLPACTSSLALWGHTHFRHRAPLYFLLTMGAVAFHEICVAREETEGEKRRLLDLADLREESEKAATAAAAAFCRDLEEVQAQAATARTKERGQLRNDLLLSLSSLQQRARTNHASPSNRAAFALAFQCARRALEVVLQALPGLHTLPEESTTALQVLASSDLPLSLAWPEADLEDEASLDFSLSLASQRTEATQTRPDCQEVAVQIRGCAQQWAFERADNGPRQGLPPLLPRTLTSAASDCLNRAVQDLMAECAAQGEGLMIPQCCGVRQCVYHVSVEALVTAALRELSQPCMARRARWRERDTARRVHTPVLLTAAREPSRTSFTSQRTVQVSLAAEPSFAWTPAPDDLLEGRETYTQHAELPTDVTLRFACVLLLAGAGGLRALRSRVAQDAGKLVDDHWPTLTIFWTSEHSAQDVIRATLSFYDSSALLVGFTVRLLEEREERSSWTLAAEVELRCGMSQSIQENMAHFAGTWVPRDPPDDLVAWLR